MRNFAIFAATIFILSACNSIPLVTLGMNGYPNPSYNERVGIKAMVSDSQRPQGEKERELSLARKVDLAQALSPDEVREYQFLRQDFRRQEEAKENQRVQLEEEKRNAEEKAKAVAAERRKAEDKAREERQKYSYYRSQYELIGSPEEAKAFVAEYAGTYDPDNLAPTAMKKAYETGIKDAQKCIDWANRVIHRQKEVAAEVGYVDKYALYEAGSQIVACRKKKQRYLSEQAKLPH